MGEVYTLQARLAAPPDVVFAALTDGDALQAWLAEHAAVSLPDRRYEFWGRYTPQGDRGRQRLLAADLDERLRFSWTLDDQDTTTDIQLGPAGPEHTVLTLAQSGVPSLVELMAPAGRRDGLHTLHTFWALALVHLAEYVEGTQATPRCDFSDTRPAEIRIELTIDASQAEVFASLVDPKQVERWFGWPVEVEQRLGGRMTLGVDGKIFEFEPGRSLGYAEAQMVLRWTLSGTRHATRLTFVQTGFAPDELDTAAQHEAGWLRGIAELKRMHELGAAWQPVATEAGPGRPG